MPKKLPFDREEYFQFLEESLKPQASPTPFLASFRQRLSRRTLVPLRTSWGQGELRKPGGGNGRATNL